VAELDGLVARSTGNQQLITHGGTPGDTEQQGQRENATRALHEAAMSGVWLVATLRWVAEIQKHCTRCDAMALNDVGSVRHARQACSDTGVLNAQTSN
jgi:hypothetical protein